MRTSACPRCAIHRNSAADERTETPLLVENFDLHKVGELASERLDALLQSHKIGLDLPTAAASSRRCSWTAL